MNYETYLPEALAVVSAWELPLEDFGQVVRDHAKLIAGESLDPMSDPSELYSEYPVAR